MNSLKLTLFFILPIVEIAAQDRIQIPEIIHWNAFRVETMKDGNDCSVISYVPQEYNRTVTPRDDKYLGVFYFVSGKDCASIFEETFASMPYHGEEFSLASEKTLDLDSFQNIQIAIRNTTIGEGATKLYLIYFHKDQNTTRPNDDIFLGMDYVIDSGDPYRINMPFDLNEIRDELESDPLIYNQINENTYYKLREMIVNENLIVEKLRKIRKLKDITPKPPKTKKVRIKPMENF